MPRFSHVITSSVRSSSQGPVDVGGGEARRARAAEGEAGAASGPGAWTARRRLGHLDSALRRRWAGEELRGQALGENGHPSRVLLALVRRLPEPTPLDWPATADWLEELVEFLRIRTSVSAEPERAGDVQRAAEWVCGFIRERAATQGGSQAASRTRWSVGEVRATTGAATRPPRVVRPSTTCSRRSPSSCGRARPSTLPCATGSSTRAVSLDDKGPLFSILKAGRDPRTRGRPARERPDRQRRRGGDRRSRDCRLHRRGRTRCRRLPRLRQHGVVRPGLPAFVVATRGLLYFHVRGAHRRIRSPLGPVRRRGAERRSTPSCGAAVRRAPGRRTPARAIAGRHRAADR